MGSKQRRPVWKGPWEDGITFSLLSRFLVCRERFRVRVVEGLRPDEDFNHKLEYGNMWHVCEEALAGSVDKYQTVSMAYGGNKWDVPLKGYSQDLCRRYPTSQEQVDHWYRVCREQFPLYVRFWADHPDVTERMPILQEQVFDVLYTLPSGRVVRLRGKWDSVDLIGKGRSAGVYLQENKTKGDVRPEQIQRQLHFDLQTMLYLVALHADWPEVMNHADNLGVWRDLPGPIGVRYNVVRRPLSGGKGTIVRHKGGKSTPRESKDAFYKRVAEYIEREPEHYFMRFKVEVMPDDVRKFRRECLDPVLEQLCEWWDWVRGNPDPFDYGGDPSNRPGMWGIHFRHPFGCFNPLNEGGAADLDGYLYSGSEAGLTRVDDLFPELGGSP